MRAHVWGRRWLRRACDRHSGSRLRACRQLSDVLAKRFPGTEGGRRLPTQVDLTTARPVPLAPSPSRLHSVRELADRVSVNEAAVRGSAARSTRHGSNSTPTRSIPSPASTRELRRQARGRPVPVRGRNRTGEPPRLGFQQSAPGHLQPGADEPSTPTTAKLNEKRPIVWTVSPAEYERRGGIGRKESDPIPTRKSPSPVPASPVVVVVRARGAEHTACGRKRRRARPGEAIQTLPSGRACSPSRPGRR